MTAASRRFGRAFVALLSISVAACGEEDAAADAGALADGGDPATAANAPAGEAGSFRIGDATYPFTVLRCDATGELYNGMVLQGAGTAPDGRRIAISVDRTGSGMITENAFVSFGSLQDGDNWSATRTGLQDGRWFMDEAATQPADGRLLRTSGNELVVEATFRRSSDDSSAPGVLRAACAS